MDKKLFQEEKSVTTGFSGEKGTSLDIPDNIVIKSYDLDDSESGILSLVTWGVLVIIILTAVRYADKRELCLA